MAGAPATRRTSAPDRGLESGRPRLWVVGPPNRQVRWSMRRAVVVAVVLVVGSLLAVAAAQAYLTQEQVHLSQLQGQLTSVVGLHRNLELRVAELENPSRVESEAQRQGLVVPSHVIDVPASSVATVPAQAVPASGSSRPRSLAPMRSDSGHRLTRTTGT